MGIYLQHNGQQVGPFTAAEVKSQLASGALSVFDHVWWKGEKGWVPLGESTLMLNGFKEPFGLGKKKPVDDLPSGLSPFALGSFLCAFISLIGGPLASIPGIVLGHLSLREIKRNPKRTGRKLAIAGLVLNYLMTVVTAVIIGSMILFSEQVSEVSEREMAETNQPPPLPTAPPAPPAATVAPATTNAGPSPAVATPPAAEAPAASAAPAAAPIPDTNALNQAVPPPSTATNTPDSNADTGPTKP